MDNHYHLVVENGSGHLSAMMKRVNGQFAIRHRQEQSGKGAVFQDRFKSTLIENNAYLITAIMYTLCNPVRGGVVGHYSRYPWSSASELLSDHSIHLTDSDFVLELFGDREGFVRQMDAYLPSQKLEVQHSRFGDLLGEEGFADRIELRYDRRIAPDAVKRKRKIDRYFEPLAKVYQEFEARNGTSVDRLDLKTWQGKRLRGELLVAIRERCGMKYSEIIELPIFSEIQLGSLGSLYWNTKKRMKIEP